MNTKEMAKLYKRFYKDLGSTMIKCMLGFKIGDSVKYKGLNITGKITGRDQINQLWIINSYLVASDEDLILDLDAVTIPDRPRKQCTCGSTSVGSDRHSSWCDS